MLNIENCLLKETVTNIETLPSVVHVCIMGYFGIWKYQRDLV